jgi:hypothetical protein
MQVGTGWQELTDRTTMTVDDFSITEVVRDVYLLSHCPYPLLKIRQYEILMRGHSNVDTRVVREIRETVRVRNDELTLACP